jgi:formamidopyrimidine-DNA glycosylase
MGVTEVPEVEIIVRDLCEAVIGRVFTGATVRLEESVLFPSVPDFANLLPGLKILDANRRAKFVLLTLSDNLMLSIHFMLWGTLKLTPTAQPLKPETLIVFHLDQEEELRLIDKLGYARVGLAAPEILAERLNLSALGPEALDPAFNVDMLARQLSHRRGVLKTLLLNQRVLAGLGNRDTDESLWSSMIDPRRPASSLTLEELSRLQAAIVQVLNEGIALRGTQPDLFGRPGKAKHRRNVFERTGEPCPRCKTRIVRIRIGGRNTHYCPNCQQ